MAKFTPEMKQASNQGIRMLRTFLYPSMPRLFRDFWVTAELAVTIYQFVLAALSLAQNRTEVFNIIYIVLAGLALLLALVDTMFHYVQLGSCATACLYCCSKFKKMRSKPVHTGYTEPESVQTCCLLSKKWRKRINESMELIRSITSELLLYPLLICDMFDFIGSQSYQRTNSGEKINFSLFIVGGFYLVLSVYIARMIMLAISLFSLRRLPRSTSHTQQTYVNLMIKFGIHILAQLLLSVIIIAAVGIKIRQENPSSDSAGSSVNASGYLIYASVAGGVIPLLGIFSFFLTNIYKVRVMSIGLWVDMVSLLQGESFTSVVFAKEGVKKAKEKAKNFAEKIHVVEVRKQLKVVLGSTPSWAKRLYPLRFPFFWVFGIFYTLLLGSFVVSLFLSEQEENFESTFFQEGLGLVSLIAATILFIANLHILFLVFVLLGIVAALLFLVALTPLFVIAAVVLYVPLGCCFGCLEYLRDVAQEMSLFSKPSTHSIQIRAALHRTRTELRK